MLLTLISCTTLPRVSMTTCFSRTITVQLDLRKQGLTKASPTCLTVAALSSSTMRKMATWMFSSPIMLTVLCCIATSATTKTTTFESKFLKPTATEKALELLSFCIRRAWRKKSYGKLEAQPGSRHRVSTWHTSGWVRKPKILSESVSTGQ